MRSEPTDTTGTEEAASEGLIGRASRLLRERSSAGSETPPEGAEEISRRPKAQSRTGSLPDIDEADTGLIEAFAERIRDTVRFSPPSLAYSLATALHDATYRRLRSGDTAAAHVISLTLAVAIELILACFIVANTWQGIQIMRIAEDLVIGVVQAQPAAPGPGALPQATVAGLVWLGAVVLAIVILGLLWSGYIARSKNEKAQTILQHVVNTVLSVATGAVVSRGISNV